AAHVFLIQACLRRHLGRKRHDWRNHCEQNAEGELRQLLRTLPPPNGDSACVMTDKLTVNVVPRIIRQHSDEVRIAATLVLRPGTIAPADNAAGSLLFENWPDIIRSLFVGHAALEAELALTDATGKLKPDQKAITSMRLAADRDFGKDPA